MKILRNVRGAAPMRYDLAQDCWFLDVDEGLPQSAVNAATAYCLKINEDRWRSFPPGDRKDLMARGLAALRAGNVKVRIAKKRGDITLFQATVRQSTTLISTP